MLRKLYSFMWIVLSLCPLMISPTSAFYYLHCNLSFFILFFLLIMTMEICLSLYFLISPCPNEAIIPKNASQARSLVLECGFSVLQVCQPGSFKKGAKCEPCAAGHSCAGGRQPQLKCPTGFFAKAGWSRCERCGPNKITSDDQGSCITCPSSASLETLNFWSLSRMVGPWFLKVKKYTKVKNQKVYCSYFSYLIDKELFIFILFYSVTFMMLNFQALK